MKKILIALLLCCVVVPAAAFDITQNATGQGNSYYEGLLDMFSTGLNSGLAVATINDGTLSLGFQFNLAVNPEDGVLASAGNKDNYIFPIFYASLCIDDFIIFGRGLLVDQKDVKFSYFGGGIGYIIAQQKTFFPQVRIIGAYHYMDAKQDGYFSLASLTGNIIGDYKLPIPLINIHLLANLAYERNMLTTDWRNVISAPNKDFGVNRFRASLGGEATVFAIVKLGYEYTILPNPNHNFSVSARF